MNDNTYKKICLKESFIFTLYFKALFNPVIVKTMFSKNQGNAHKTSPSSLAKSMLIGVIIAVLLMVLFLSGVQNADPSWGEYWKIRPLAVITFAGLMGGLCFYLITLYFANKGWNKFLAILISICVYIFGLWIGSVLGFDGTLWN